MAAEIEEFESSHVDEHWKGPEVREADVEQARNSNHTDEMTGSSESLERSASQSRKLFVSGVTTSLAIFLHNFPEGTHVSLSALFHHA
jgi:zinc transporter ZupT